MPETEGLAERFEADRDRLRGVAYRMLGSLSEADDAVQEAWLRLTRSDARAVDNLSGWLTTVVARICLDMLRSRKSRREEPLSERPIALELGPEEQTLLADSVGIALLVVLETLAPSERVAFVLHDMFDLSFDEIAPIVGRSPVAARQLASRARRRVRGVEPPPSAEVARKRRIVEAFLAASRSRDFEALIALLDPNVVLRSDQFAVGRGAVDFARGAAAVAETFSVRERGARLAVVDGEVGAVWTVLGKPSFIYEFAIEGGRVTGITLVAEPARVANAQIEALSD